MAIPPWLHYADPSLAPICRSRRGSNMPVGDTCAMPPFPLPVWQLVRIVAGVLPTRRVRPGLRVEALTHASTSLPGTKSPKATRSAFRSISSRPPPSPRPEHFSTIVNTAPRTAPKCSRPRGTLFTLAWNRCSPPVETPFTIAWNTHSPEQRSSHPINVLSS